MLKNEIDNLYQQTSLTLSALMQRTRMREIDRPFIIIGISGCLHLVDLCLRYFPSNQKIIIVSNGLSHWENDWARNNLKYDCFIRFNKKYYHALIIDFVISFFDEPFGIIDYDCFVFDQSFFEKIKQINSDTLLNSAFLHRNSLLSLDFPETFFLFFNTKLIKSIKKKYQVSSKPVNFSMLSRKVIKTLSSIGITEDCYPEEYKNYFDTIRLWACLGLAEGYKFNFIANYSNIPKIEDQIFHVGSGSSHSDFKTPWRARGTYFWRRALEECDDKDLQNEYWNQFGKITSQKFLDDYPDITKQLGKDYFNKIERTIYK